MQFNCDLDEPQKQSLEPGHVADLVRSVIVKHLLAGSLIGTV